MAGYTYDTPPSATGAPPRLTIATCQFPVTHDIARNLAQIERLLRQAAARGADLAHLPECALGGYGPAAWPDWQDFNWAEHDRALERLRALCRAHRIWAVVGANHRDGAAAPPTNSVHVIDGGGDLVARYDKRRCSLNDLRAFARGDRAVTFTVNGVRCGVLICLEWAFPELWQAYAEDGVELILLSVHDAGMGQRERNHEHTIAPLMQGYGFLHGLAISLSNSSRRRQLVPSLWVERSGHGGGRCRRNVAGMTVNHFPDDAEQDAFFRLVRQFRAAARDGSLHPGWRPTGD